MPASARTLFRLLAVNALGVGMISVAAGALRTEQPEKPAPTEPANSAPPAAAPAKKSDPKAAVPEARAEKPGVPLGTKIGEGKLLDESGKEVKLSSLAKDGPVVVTFYRGGWCPFCNKALSAWDAKLDELKAAGATFVAITPENPELTIKTKEKAKGHYRVLCDSEMDAAKAFKVIFRLDEATQKKYQGYGVDLAKNNACKEWDLPAPATFVLDKDGVVRWSFADWDYAKRAEPDEVIKAVKALAPGKSDAKSGGK